LFCQHVLESHDVHGLIGHHAAQLGVLSFELTEPLRVVHGKAAELGLPGVECGRADAGFAAHLGCWTTALLLFEDADDLLLTEPAVLHEASRLCPIPILERVHFRGARHLHHVFTHMPVGRTLGSPVNAPRFC